MSDGTPSELGINIEQLDLLNRYTSPATNPTGTACRVLRVPDDPKILAAVDEVLAILTNPDVWNDENGGVPDDSAALIAEMLSNYWNEDCMSQLTHELHLVTTIAEASIELIDLDTLPAGDLIIQIAGQTDGASYEDLIVELNGDTTLNYLNQSNQYAGVTLNQITGWSNSLIIQLVLPYVAHYGNVEIVIPEFQHPDEQHLPIRYSGSTYNRTTWGSTLYTWGDSVDTVKLIPETSNFDIGTTIDVFVRGRS